MPEFSHPMETWTAIQEFGFEPDASVISDGGTGLSCNLGQFRLSAGQMVNLYCQEIVQFSAIYQTPNSLGMLDFEMPTHVESLEPRKLTARDALKKPLLHQAFSGAL